jgi:hypothetical protein
LTFQYEANGSTTVLKYTAELSGNTMTLQLDGGKSKTVYQRG